jgi:hypothetical protein
MPGNGIVVKERKNWRVPGLPPPIPVLWTDSIWFGQTTGPDFKASPVFICTPVAPLRMCVLLVHFI